MKSLSIYTHRRLRQTGPWLLVAAWLLLLTVHQEAWAIHQWTNTEVDAAAGDWFSGANWDQGTVPNSTITAQVNNGGEAKATTATATGPITANLLDVGKNGGTGRLTDQGVDLSIGTSLDLGVVDGLVADGAAVTVISAGHATITDVTNIQFGLTGLGDINVAQTAALNGATAQGTATLLIERAGSIQLASDFDVGQTSGTGIATGFGTCGDPTTPGTIDNFNLIGTALGYSGTFDSFEYDGVTLVPTFGPDLDGDFQVHVGDGLFRAIDYKETNVNFINLKALAGDANGDRAVDLVDFAIWQSNRFQPGDWTDGDFDGDGMVDVRDFNLWNEHKITFYGTVNPAVVPEPSTISLLVLAVVFLIQKCGHGRRSGLH